MDTVEEFLAHSIKLEQEAALRFGQLADAMESLRQQEVSKLFRQLSDYSRMHQADAQARAGFRDIPEMKADDFKWPGLESPETAAIWGTDPFISRDLGLEIALEAETGAFNWYKNVLDTTDQSGDQGAGEGIRRGGKRPRRRAAPLDRPAQIRRSAAEGNRAVLSGSIRSHSLRPRSCGARVLIAAARPELHRLLRRRFRSISSASRACSSADSGGAASAPVAAAGRLRLLRHSASPPPSSASGGNSHSSSVCSLKRGLSSTNSP